MMDADTANLQVEEQPINETKNGGNQEEREDHNSNSKTEKKTIIYRH